MSGGRITLGICIAIGITGAAFGQSNALFSPEAMVMHQTTPPVLKDLARKPANLPAPETVVIRHGQGGRVREHQQRFADYQLTRTKVELRGPCYSACTLITAYVAKADLCIGEGAFLAFHAVRSLEKYEIMPFETGQMYRQFPDGIRRWIDRYGGYEKLPLDGYWTMYDRDLWSMGYPRCTP